MENQIEKLTCEYEDKIGTCDDQIRNCVIRKSTARRNGNKRDVDDLSREVAIISAQRQAFVQAKVDIDSLLDHLEA